MGNCLFGDGGRAEGRFHHAGGAGPPAEEEDLAALCERHRRRAEEASKAAQDLKVQSQAAWRAGDRKRAKELSDLAKAKKAGL